MSATNYDNYLNSLAQTDINRRNAMTGLSQARLDSANAMEQQRREENAYADKYNEQFRTSPPQQASVTRFDALGVPNKTNYEFGGDLYKMGVQDKADKLRLAQAGIDVEREKIGSESEWRKYDANERAQALRDAATEKAMSDFASNYIASKPNARPVDMGRAWNEFSGAARTQIKPPTGIDDVTPPGQPGPAPSVQPQRFTINPNGSSQPIGSPMMQQKSQAVKPQSFSNPENLYQMQQPSSVGMPTTQQPIPKRRTSQPPAWLSTPILPTLYSSFKKNIEERRNRVR